MPGRGPAGMPEGQGPGLHHLSAPRIWPSLGTECSVFEGGPEAEMGERPYGGTGQGQGPKCGCVYSWMVTCHLTAVWRTTCCCCPLSDPRMQAPTSALPLTARARSKPLPICRCQVRQHPPGTGSALPTAWFALYLTVLSAGRAGGTLLHTDPALLPAAAHHQGCLQEV